MAGKASPKVGAKRSRDEESDDADAEKSEAKVAKEEEPKVENGADEKESTVVGAADTKPAADEKKEDAKPAAVPCSAAVPRPSVRSVASKFRIREARRRGSEARRRGGSGFSSGGGFGGFAKAAGPIRRLSACSAKHGTSPSNSSANDIRRRFRGDDDDDAAPEALPRRPSP